MYTPEETWDPNVRVLGIHQEGKQWYFTIHKSETLFYTSPLMDDRGKVTADGIQYLDTLRKLEGTSNG